MRAPEETLINTHRHTFWEPFTESQVLLQRHCDSGTPAQTAEAPRFTAPICNKAAPTPQFEVPRLSSTGKTQQKATAVSLPGPRSQVSVETERSIRVSQYTIYKCRGPFQSAAAPKKPQDHHPPKATLRSSLCQGRIFLPPTQCPAAAPLNHREHKRFPASTATIPE